MNKIDYTLVDKAIANPDVFTTLIILFLFIFIMIIIIIPMIYSGNKRFDKMIKIFQDHGEEDNQNLQKLNTSLVEIKNAIENHNNESKEQFNIIRDNIGRVTLDKEQTIDLLKTQMWYVTGKKLEFIKGIILNNHIEGNEIKVREKVSNGLMAFSDEYLSKFPSYKTPIGDLSKWLNANFGEDEFNKLVDDIIIIIYKKYKGNDSDNTLNKINEISMIMRTLQVGLANKLRSDIYKI